MDTICDIETSNLQYYDGQPRAGKKLSVNRTTLSTFARPPCIGRASTIVTRRKTNHSSSIPYRVFVNSCKLLFVLIFFLLRMCGRRF